VAKTESIAQKKHAYVHILYLLANSRLGKGSFRWDSIQKSVNFPTFVGRSKSGLDSRIRSALKHGERLGLLKKSKLSGGNTYRFIKNAKVLMKEMYPDLGRSYRNVNTFRKAQEKMSLPNPPFTKQDIELSNMLSGETGLSAARKKGFERLKKITTLTQTPLDRGEMAVRFVQRYGTDSLLDSALDKVYNLALKLGEKIDKEGLSKREENKIIEEFQKALDNAIAWRTSKKPVYTPGMKRRKKASKKASKSKKIKKNPPRKPLSKTIRKLSRRK
jgi:hypothetical protein